MRNTIKSDEYFREYLTLNAKRIERFQNQLALMEPENVMGRQIVPHLSQICIEAEYVRYIPPAQA